MTNSEAIQWFRNAYPKFICDSDTSPIGMAISALEKQEQSCDTCKHGRFGDRRCDNCAVKFPNHYEAEAEEEA